MVRNTKKYTEVRGFIKKKKKSKTIQLVFFLVSRSMAWY